MTPFKKKIFGQLTMAGLFVALMITVSGCSLFGGGSSTPAATTLTITWYNLNTGATMNYHTTGTREEYDPGTGTMVPTTVDETTIITVIGPETFNNDPAAVKVQMLSPLMPAGYEIFSYYKLVPEGILELGSATYLNGNLDSATYLDPATLYPGGAVAGSTIAATSCSTTTVDGSGNPIDTGNRSMSALTVVGLESVTVPAGTFNAVKITSEGQTAWLASGIGVVKSTYTSASSSQTMELTSYTK